MTEALQIDDPRFPRRSKKKRQTRDRIIAAASKLFREVGYSDTTMADISQEADVHVTTLFTHFKAKRDLATAISERSIEQLEELIAAARGRVPFFTFFRGLVREWARSYAGARVGSIAYGHEFRENPELAFSWLRYHQREVDLFAAYIAADYGLNLARDFRPVLVANMLSAGNVIAHDRWLESKGKSSVERDALAALDAIESLVGTSLQAVAAPSFPRA
jgi:AcrR family transcriptional regulator